jgi:two-component system OmpR family response regulator
VLEFLARRPGRVVSRSELLDEVWSDYEGSPNITDVYVGYLRKKLGRAVIRTVRGSGFVLEP